MLSSNSNNRQQENKDIKHPKAIVEKAYLHALFGQFAPKLIPTKLPAVMVTPYDTPLKISKIPLNIDALDSSITPSNPPYATVSSEGHQLRNIATHAEIPYLR